MRTRLLAVVSLVLATTVAACGGTPGADGARLDDDMERYDL